MTSNMKRCYICLNDIKRKLIDIKCSDGDQVSYSKKLQTLLNTDLVIIEEMMICENCLKDLQTSYNFVKKVNTSQKTLIREKLVRSKILRETHRKVSEIKPATDNPKKSVKKIIKSEPRLIETVTLDSDNEINDDSKSDIKVLKSTEPILIESITLDSDNEINEYKSVTHYLIKDLSKKAPKYPRKKQKGTNKCEQCNLEFDRPWKLRHHDSTVHDEKKFICTICNKVLLHSFTLQEHMSIHTGEKNYRCKICAAEYKRRSSLYLHERKHNGVKPKRTPFLCNQCGKSFPFSNSMQRHLRMHAGIKRHPCLLCGKRFAQPQHVKVHMRSHTGEKPYICEGCGVSFAFKQTLDKHRENRHGEKSEKRKKQVVPKTNV